VIVTLDDAPDVLRFVSDEDSPPLSQVGPATPDHTIYTKRLPCFVTTEPGRSLDELAEDVRASVDRFVGDYTRYFESHNSAGAELVDPFPRVVLVPGIGMLTAGKDRRTADIVSDIYHHTIDVIGNASAFGRYVSLTARDAFDVEYWPLELYKLTLAPPEKELARRIALVTGGASGIGRAVARRLAAEGAHVRRGRHRRRGERARRRPKSLRRAGPDAPLGLEMDVTREASVRAAFESTVLAYGGLDILVSNAGIAHGAPVARMELVDWERSFAVNATGHFIVAREAMRILMAQGLGGALVFVATKNVMSPGKDFAAYSAAKAAEAQLAKVLALEGAPHGIRSNIVNPDAVFQDSGLWSEAIRRERAAAQGIAVDQLEDFYRRRNLLGASHPARRCGRGRAVLCLRPLGEDDRLHADRRRRREGRVSPVTPAARLGVGAQLKARHAPAAQWDLVRAVESFGYDSVWTGDHVSFHNPLYESLTLLASYASITSRVRLGTGVYLLALRAPAIAAKITATLDALSGGRLIFGGRGGRREPEGIRALRGAARGARRARERGDRRRADAVARHPCDVQGTLQRLPERLDRSEARPGRRSAHLDRRTLGRRTGARGTAGRRLGLVCRPAGALYAKCRQDPRRGPVSRTLARRLHVRPPDVHHGGSRCRAGARDVGTTAERAVCAGLRSSWCRSTGVVGTPEQCAEQLARFRAAGCGYFVMDAICDLDDEQAQLETIARDVVPRLRAS
jgi:NAD(P)-dependent dehydrogenase (short-subunit alcohol dehydrogenase family)